MTSNSTCSDSETNPCSGHGLCVEGECKCFYLFTGSNCSINKIDTTPGMPEFFWIHVYVFSLCYLAIAVFGTLQLIFLLRQHRHNWKAMNKASVSVYALLVFAATSRIVLLLLDPYRYRGNIPAALNNVIYGLAVFALVAIYLLILLMWIEIYNATCYTKALDRAVRIAWIVIPVVFVLQLIYDIIRGIYGAGVIRLIILSVYTAVFALGTLTVSILFLIYGRKMYRRLKRFSPPQEAKKKMKRIHRFARVVSIVTIIIILELIFFVVLAFLIGENIILEMVSNTLERAIEIIYCLIIIFTHRRNLKADKKQSQTMPTQKDDTQHSTNANPSVNDSKE